MSSSLYLFLTTVAGIILTGAVGFALIGLYLSVRAPHPEAFQVPEEIAREVGNAVRRLFARLSSLGLALVRAVARAARKLTATESKGPRNPPGRS